MRRILAKLIAVRPSRAQWVGLAALIFAGFGFRYTIAVLPISLRPADRSSGNEALRSIAVAAYPFAYALLFAAGMALLWRRVAGLWLLISALVLEVVLFAIPMLCPYLPSQCPFCDAGIYLAGGVLVQLITLFPIWGLKLASRELRPNRGKSEAALAVQRSRWARRGSFHLGADIASTFFVFVGLQFVLFAIRPGDRVWHSLSVVVALILSIANGYLLRRSRRRRIKRLWKEDLLSSICPVCTHDTRGLPSDICPECGIRLRPIE